MNYRTLNSFLLLMVLTNHLRLEKLRRLRIPRRFHAL